MSGGRLTPEDVQRLFQWLHTELDRSDTDPAIAKRIVGGVESYLRVIAHADDHENDLEWLSGFERYEDLVQWLDERGRA